MSLDVSSGLVRISKIAGRFLVFDADHVAHIRRNHTICSVLVGTTPQNATQNVFLSLPLELLPEEARLLIDNNVGYLVDEASYHVSCLRSPDKATRQAYIDLLKDRRQKAQRLVAEEHARKLAEHSRRAKGRKTTALLRVEVDLEIDGTSSPADTETQTREGAPGASIAVTPTTSDGLICSTEADSPPVANPPPSPLYAHLQSVGYYMTPGLRFGADYSVYPGDPLRYHAHFLATNYGWDEEIPILDIVGSGRLGTSVKKGFLIGGEVPGGSHRSDKNGVRAFCIEWAGM